jgi:hypothetical protein
MWEQCVSGLKRVTSRFRHLRTHPLGTTRNGLDCVIASSSDEGAVAIWSTSWHEAANVSTVEDVVLAGCVVVRVDDGAHQVAIHRS